MNNNREIQLENEFNKLDLEFQIFRKSVREKIEHFIGIHKEYDVLVDLEEYLEELKE